MVPDLNRHRLATLFKKRPGKRFFSSLATFNPQFSFFKRVYLLISAADRIVDWIILTQTRIPLTPCRCSLLLPYFRQLLPHNPE
jgi:hypothetical protein